MDPTRFDSLTKSLAAGVSRRSVLKGLASAVAGSFAGGLGSVAAGQCRVLGHRCTVANQCCSGVCTFDARDRGRCGSCPEQACPAHEYLDPRDCQCHCNYGRQVCAANEVCTLKGCVLGCMDGQKLCGQNCISVDACCTDEDCVSLDNQCQRGVCQNGDCAGSLTLVCTTDNDCLEAQCDPTLGCITSPKGQGEPCNDGSPCTTGDACDGAGHCLASGVVQCDDCNACDTTTGQCVPDLDQDQQACSGNGNQCYQRFVCDTGSCIGIQPVQCVAQDACHVVGTCDPMTGCSHPPAPNGTSCGAGQICISGACTAGCFIDGAIYYPGDVDPFNACQTCQPASSTTSWTIATGAPCVIGGSNGTCCADGQCCASPECTCCGAYSCVKPNLCRGDGDCY